MAENNKNHQHLEYTDDLFVEKRLSEIDKLIKEENIDKESIFDNFYDSHKDKEKAAASHSGYASSKGTKKNVTKRNSTRVASEKRRRERTAHSHSEKYDNKKKSKTKTFIAIFAVIAVLVGAGFGTYTYLNGFSIFDNTAGSDNKGISQKSENETTTVNPHELLAVITVSDKTISFNGEELTSAEELEVRLQNEEHLTLSLVNVDANPEVYNRVAQILNNNGGTYELMDEENTNPSINTDKETTTASEESTIAN